MVAEYPRGLMKAANGLNDLTMEIPRVRIPRFF